VEKISKPLVLVLGHRFSSLEIERDVLDGTARLVDANELSKAELSSVLQRAAVVMLGTGAQVGPDRVRAMKACRAIIRYGIGIDNVALDEATRQGIAVANVPDYCIEEVSDHALTLLLAASRRLLSAVEAARRGAWGTGIMKGVERLGMQTLGLVAFGRIAQALARKARPLVKRVVAFDPGVEAEVMAAQGVEAVDFDTLLSSSDYISIHCPLNDQTRHLFDAEALSRMKDSAWLINTARGGIVDQEALEEALNEGNIAGAALDVLEMEPPGDVSLLELPNSIITPHVAYYSRRAIEDLQRTAAEQAFSVLRGRRPEWQLNELVSRGAER